MNLVHSLDTFIRRNPGIFGMTSYIRERYRYGNRGLIVWRDTATKSQAEEPFFTNILVRLMLVEILCRYPCSVVTLVGLPGTQQDYLFGIDSAGRR
ncbi:hypothetical protein TNCV_800371 [Trichonephila clavipes]|nr:hypothetical protein TNCV_800371 [Trichonephila clavipes]